MHPAALRAELAALADEAAGGEVDHDAIGRVVDAIDDGARSGGWSADDVHQLLDALAPLIDAVETRKDEVGDDLRSTATRSRAARGYGRPAGGRGLTRGQRINRGV